MAQFVKLNPEALQPLREVDARLVSYDGRGHRRNLLESLHPRPDCR